MQARRRNNSLEGRPDLRKKENRFLVPPAPDHYTPYQKRQWREEQLSSLLGTNTQPVVQQAPQPIPVQRAVAAGVSCQPARRRNPSSFSNKLWRLVCMPFGLKSVSGLVVLVAMWMVSGDQGAIYQVARLLGAAATIGEATSDVAVQALNFTGTLTSSATELVLAAAQSGLSASTNAWRGVDITDLRATRCAGVIQVSDALVLETWFETSQAHTLFPCVGNSLQKKLIAAARTLDDTLPTAQSSQEDLDVATSFSAVKIHGALLPTGVLQLSFEEINLTFALLWANPLWETMDYDETSEREQVLDSLRSTIRHLPGPPARYDHQLVELKSVQWTSAILARLANWSQATTCWLYRQALAVEPLQGGGIFTAVVNYGLWLTAIVLLLLTGYLWKRHAIGVSSENAMLSILDGTLETPSQPEPEEAKTPVSAKSQDSLSERSVASDFSKGSFTLLSKLSSTSSASLPQIEVLDEPILVS